MFDLLFLQLEVDEITLHRVPLQAALKRVAKPIPNMIDIIILPV